MPQFTLTLIEIVSDGIDFSDIFKHLNTWRSCGDETPKVPKLSVQWKHILILVTFP